MECPRGDISERLALALWPDEFPNETREIREHLRDCPACQGELNMLKQVYEVLKENRKALAGAAAECPSVETITRFAKGEHVDASVAGHLKCCPDCREEVELIRESLQSVGSTTDEVPSTATVARVKQVVAREYAGTEETGRTSIINYVRELFSGFHIPVMVAGAVAAAVLLVVLMHRAPEEAPFRVALSTAVWDAAPRTLDKAGDVFEPSGRARKKVAVVILAKESSRFSPKDVDDIYRRIEIPDRLTESYEFISPVELTKVLAEFQGKGVPPNDLARQIFGKTDAQDFLAFQIESDQAGATLKATRFRRGDGSAIGSLSQSGLKKEGLPQRIMGMSADLLFGSPRS